MIIDEYIILPWLRWAQWAFVQLRPVNIERIVLDLKFDTKVHML